MRETAWATAAGKAEAACGGPRFLDADAPEDRAAWLELWRDWPRREVMAHPDYVRLFARRGDRAMAAAVRTESGGILYPFLVRPLASEPWAPDETDRCDLTTPYGYGGPFAWNATDEDARRFWLGFESWCASQGVVTSFARLSVFPEALLAFPGEVVDRGPCVVRRLDLSEEELWADYEGKVRTKVRKARNLGLRFELDPEGKRLDEFMAVYTATMDRRGAAAQYYFPRSFYEAIIRDLSGHYFFGYVLFRGQVVVADLVLLSGDVAYGYLTGTLAEAMPLGGTDFVRHETFLVARGMGKKAYVMGGGYRPDDGILAFKRGFAPGGELPFRLGFRTFDAPAAARLLAKRSRWESENGRGWTPAPGFLPGYRS